MSKNRLKGKVNPYMMGNYTKGAVESFEENIVEQTNYLEKVNANLKNKEK